jgi:hypothetical protein
METGQPPTYENRTPLGHEGLREAGVVGSDGLEPGDISTAPETPVDVRVVRVAAIGA